MSNKIRQITSLHASILNFVEYSFVAVSGVGNQTIFVQSLSHLIENYSIT